ncbi:MAG TPA: retropepsin-like aspartic protease [Chthonomonadaceae bacterium]|nr:retropepsin-like aspartic protease [Chthonomonadaceae bacterium]
MVSPRWRILGALLCLCALQIFSMAASGQPLPSTTLPSEHFSTQIPCSPAAWHGLPLITLPLTNTISGAFLLDTGTAASLISKTLADRLRLSPGSVAPDNHQMAQFGDIMLPVMQLSRFHLGTLPLPDAPFLVYDHFRALSDIGVEGVIGTNFLTRMAILFDFQHGRLTFWFPGGLSTAEIEQSGFTQDEAVPLSIRQDGPDGQDYSIPIGIDASARETMRIDTGAGYTSLSASLARTLRLQPFYQGEEVDGFRGVSKMNRAHVPALSLGRQILKDLPVSYPLTDPGPTPPSLGMDILSRFRVLMDIPNGKIYFKPVEDPEANSAPPDGRTYQWTFRYRPGETFRRSSRTMATGQLPDGSPLQKTAEGISDYKVTQVDALGNATVVITDEPDKPSSGTSNKAAKAPVIMRIYSKTGLILQQTVQNPDPSAGNGDDFAALVANLPVPDRPVRIGDTWQTTVANRLVKDRHVLITSRLLGHAPGGAADTLRVQIRMEIPLDEAETECIHARGAYDVSATYGRMIRADYTFENVPVPIAKKVQMMTMKVVTKQISLAGGGDNLPAPDKAR